MNVTKMEKYYAVVIASFAFSSTTNFEGGADKEAGDSYACEKN